MPELAIGPHIRFDAEGRAWIDDTNVKVIEVALDHVAYGWSADEMQHQHPNLSLGQIHAALAHYYDYQAEFDREIQASLERAEAAAAAAQGSPGRDRLRRLSKLR